jgi:hypothetical protein
VHFKNCLTRLVVVAVQTGVSMNGSDGLREVSLTKCNDSQSYWTSSTLRFSSMWS